MSKETINIGDTGKQLVDKLGNNFNEIYDAIQRTDAALSEDPPSLTSHIKNKEIHVSPEDRARWDAAVSRTAKRYGIRWDRVNAQCTRLWDAEIITINTTNFGHFGSPNTNYDNPFDSLYPWSHRKLCNVNLSTYANIYDAGGNIMDAITAWEGEPDFAYDGSNGAVMVYTPEFWAYGERGDDYDIYGVADLPVEGWTHVPFYIGARYHGSQDGSGGITSVAGAIAWRGTSIQTMLQAAKSQRMTLDDIWTWSADTLLLCVEYATLNTQNAVGQGCASLYGQGATGSEWRPLMAETGANRVIAPVAMQAMADRPGAVLDIGTSNGGLNVATRVVSSVETYPDNAVYIIINFYGAPVNILTTHYLSIHGCYNAPDAAIGGASGYIGVNGYCNAYYRGRVAHANYWRYVPGAYRQTGAGTIWVAHGRKEAQESETGLNTAKHIDTGLVLPSGTDGAAVSAYLSALHFLSGMPLAPFASAATGGNSTNPVGDYVYTPTLATTNTILLAGANASHGAACGRFFGSWNGPSSTSAWSIAVAPFLITP